MDVFSAQGLKLPEELSVTGFDDNPLAKLVTPRLTTIPSVSFSSSEGSGKTSYEKDTGRSGGCPQLQFSVGVDCTGQCEEQNL